MLKHFTATGYIVSKFNNEFKVLLHKHKKLNIWIGIGGHVEENENPVEAVLREVKEETNLKVKLLKNDGKLVKTADVTQLPTPQAIIEEKIPKYKRKAAHFHIDHIYFAFCKNPREIKMREEYAWFSHKMLSNSGLEKEVEVFAKKAIDKAKKFMLS